MQKVVCVQIVFIAVAWLVSVSAVADDTEATVRMVRHTAKGATSFEALAARAYESFACRGEAAIIEFGRLDAERIKQFEAVLRKLPPLEPIATKLDRFDRFLFLESVAAIARETKMASAFGSDRLQSILKEAAGDPEYIDWNTILRWGNQQYDELVRTANTSDPVERHKIEERLDESWQQSVRERQKLSNQLLRFLQGKSLKSMRTEAIRDIIYSLLAPAAALLGDSQQAGEVRLLVVRTAFALAAYRLERGELPESLEGLVPEYLDRIPMDPFSGNPLVYKRRAEGFIVYSVGVRREDDGGIGSEDREPEQFGDDIVIRIPQTLQ